jgi:ADP-ribose pyrophosphatase YjhB (NUDIX family)
MGIFAVFWFLFSLFLVRKMLRDGPRPLTKVGVVLRRSTGEIVVGLRHGAQGAGTWGLPGGEVAPHETVIDAVARELREETGVRLALLNAVPLTWTTHVSEGAVWVTLFVLVGVDDVDLEVREPDKCHEWRWAMPEDLPTPLFAPLRGSNVVPLLLSGHFDVVDRSTTSGS